MFKNLQAEEAEALLRVRAHRNAAGDCIHMQFSRYGKRVKLDRYLRDHPGLHEKLRQKPSDDSLVDDLIERYLPSRGLVALESPQRYLRGEEGLHLTEAAMYSLQSFHSTESSWNINGRNRSISWIREATWKQSDNGVLAESQVDRDAAWSGIEQACRLLQMDMATNPGSFALDVLWLFAITMDEGQVLHLACQLAQHISLLSGLVLGVQNPYHNMFTGLFRFIQDSLSTGNLSFKDFHARISEVLVDIIVKRVHAGSVDGICNETLSLMHKVVAPSTRERIKAALQIVTINKASNEDFTRVAVILARMHLRDGDYLTAHALHRAITDRRDDMKGGIFNLFESLRCCALLGDWDEFARVAGFLEIGLDSLIEDLPRGLVFVRNISNIFRRSCYSLKKVLMFIKEDKARTDRRDLGIAWLWLDQVLQDILRAHAIGRECTT